MLACATENQENDTSPTEAPKTPITTTAIAVAEAAVTCPRITHIATISARGRHQHEKQTTTM